MNPGSRREIEKAWRDRLHSAETRYHLASANYRRIEEEYEGHSIPPPDSGLRLRQALQMENHARAEYVRVLQTFTRLVLYGEVPRDEERSA